jgi:sugar lactone lactonase YvrE
MSIRNAPVLPMGAALLALLVAADAHTQPVPGDSVIAPESAVAPERASTVAFYIDEKDLLPESVAFDPKDKSFYVGSTRKGKIVRVDAEGNATDFIAPRQDGLWQVIGLKINPTRRILWACSFDGENLEGYKPGDTRATGVFAFNLDTGKLVRKWTIEKQGEVHAFNDLVLTRGNDAYVTHMFDDAAIYRISDKTQTLEVLARPAGLKDPNGITITPNEATLFVAGADGIYAIDRATGASRTLQAAEGDPLAAIDGLHYYRGSLIAVHMTSVRRHRLDGANTRVVSTEILEADHPLFDVPTTGVVVGDDFYYVANSQFNAVLKDGSLLPMEQMNEPAILKLRLR